MSWRKSPPALRSSNRIQNVGWSLSYRSQHFSVSAAYKTTPPLFFCLLWVCFCLLPSLLAKSIYSEALYTVEHTAWSLWTWSWLHDTRIDLETDLERPDGWNLSHYTAARWLPAVSARGFHHFGRRTSHCSFSSRPSLTRANLNTCTWSLLIKFHQYFADCCDTAFTHRPWEGSQFLKRPSGDSVSLSSLHIRFKLRLCLACVWVCVLIQP